MQTALFTNIYPASPHQHASAGRPHVPSIATRDDGRGHLSHYPTFGTAAQNLRSSEEVPEDDEPEDPQHDCDHFKAASAPGPSNAFPPDADEQDSRGSEAVSPAAMFLSAFTPSVPSLPPPPDSAGQEIAGYTLGAVIGHGGFSTIRRAQSSSGAAVAIKIVRRADIALLGDSAAAAARRQLDTEAAVWSALSHEHVMPLFAVTRTPYADWFVTLLCPAGSLFDILKRDGTPALPQDDAGTMFRQVVRGLRYLHDVARVVHGDIKLENVLVDEMGMCRIGDFGLARRIGEVDEEREREKLRRQGTPGLSAHLSLRRSGPARHRNSTPFPIATPHGYGNEQVATHPSHQFQPGSLPYAAPELLMPTSNSAHGPNAEANPAQDMWALGVLLYALLTGCLPFTDAFEPRLQMKILHGTYEPPRDIGHGAEQVLTGCLARDPEERWTVDMVDEVAWGVGWGATGDGLTPSLSEEIENRLYSRNTSQSKSRSRPRPYPHTGSTTSSARSVSRSSRSATRDAVDHVSPHELLQSFAQRPPLRGRRSRKASPPDALSFSYSSLSSTSTSDSVPASLSPSRSRSRTRSLSPSVPPLTPVDAAPDLPLVRGRTSRAVDRGHLHYASSASRSPDVGVKRSEQGQGAGTAPGRGLWGRGRGSPDG